MQKDIVKALPLFVLLFTVLWGCKKDKEVVKEEIISLRDKPVAEAKAYARGNWKIHYSYGGLTGNMKTLTPNSYFRVLPNDSIYLTFNHQLFAADRGSFYRDETIFGHTAVIMNFQSINHIDHQWIIDSKKGDTLLVVNNATETDTYFMTPVQ